MSARQDYLIEQPLTPTWGRYRRLFYWSNRFSILRTLEYEKLPSIHLSGRILDFGGGELTNYRPKLSMAPESVYESANIDPAINPTYLLSPGQSLPVDDGTYDFVIAYNTLEHVYETENALSEFGRVLKHGGKIVFFVPFLYHIHASPDDFIRGTPSWWARKLATAGCGQIVFTPLEWGFISTGASFVAMSLPAFLGRLCVHAGLLLDVLYARLRALKGSRLPRPCIAPFGFLITAAKVSSNGS